MPRVIIELEDGVIESDSFIVSVIRKDDDLCYTKVVTSTDGLDASEVLVLVSSVLHAASCLLESAAGADLLFNEERDGGGTNGS